jgi:hypothetical protein
MDLQRLRFFLCGISLCVLLAGCNPVVVVPPPPPPPAIAATIASAKTVFVSNLGSDKVVADNIKGGANASYNEFYASLQRWGHFQLVGSPKGADLVFEIRTTEQGTDYKWIGPGIGQNSFEFTNYPAIISLTIRKASDQSILWTTTAQYLQGPVPKGIFKHFDQAVENLTNQLKAFVSPSAAVTPSKK